MLPTLLISDEKSNALKSQSTLVCYGRLEPEFIIGYDLLIIEAAYYSLYDINRLKSQNGRVIAYISLGEINESSPYFPSFKNHFVGKNDTWNSHYLNLKANEVQAIIMGMIKSLMKKGFDGLFFDNVDNFSSYGPQFQQQKELIQLLKNINSVYPNHYFIQNSGMELVLETEKYIDALVMESVITDYTFDEKGYHLREETSANLKLKMLKELKRKYRFPILLIEYSDSPELNEAIEKKIQKYPFDYFIGTINLQTIPQF